MVGTPPKPAQGLELGDLLPGADRQTTALTRSRVTRMGIFLEIFEP